MAVDLALLYPCPPRDKLGDGDPGRGTEVILDCLKARSRAEALAEVVRRDGRSPEGVSVTVHRYTPDGLSEPVEVTYEELLEQAAPLDEHAGHCTNCPANLLKEPYGCVGAINYPIRRAAEEWLIGLARPADEAGGFLFLRAIEDFGYDGEPIRRFRQAGLFELKRGLTKKLGPGKTVSSDQLFQAVFCIGEPLDPGHCMGVLLWLGALTLDGDRIAGPDGLRELLGLDTPKERTTRARLAVGRRSDDADVAAVQRLLLFLYGSWVFDTPLYVSA